MTNPSPSNVSGPRRIVVTGATGVLGSAVVSRFLDAGDRVIGVHSPGSTPAPHEGVEWKAVDLVDSKSVTKFFADLGEIESVVHCAGGFRFGKIDETSSDDFTFLTRLNFESSFFVAAGAVPGMKKRKRGSLLFISSSVTLNPPAGLSVYAASKSAVNALVQSLASELKSDGIRVNAVLPSVIDTPTNRKDMPDADPKKWVSPQEIAELLYDLTLPKSNSITGALIPIVGRI
jgi:NAD(P)-dependent dehydrogenase (short-subunit alcohol dehydrogenase family)